MAEKTVEQVRDEFVTNVKNMVDYWAKVDVDTTKERLEGVAFSIMSALDGCAMALPPFIVSPLAFEEEKKEAIDNDDDYYPVNDGSTTSCDISGSLHDCFSRKCR